MMPPEPTAHERAEDLIRRLHDACFEVEKLPGLTAYTIAQLGEVIGELRVHPPHDGAPLGAIVLTRCGDTRGWGRVFDLLERHLVVGRDRFYA